jgi:hypothetical protein
MDHIVDRRAVSVAYARVDTVVIDNALWVLEIEVIDPTLFFDLHPPAAIRLAEALCAIASVS